MCEACDANGVRAEDVAQLVAGLSSPAFQLHADKLHVELEFWKPNTNRVETGESKVQSYPWLRREFETIGYSRLSKKIYTEILVLLV